MGLGWMGGGERDGKLPIDARMTMNSDVVF